MSKGGEFQRFVGLADPSQMKTQKGRGEQRNIEVAIRHGR